MSNGRGTANSEARVKVAVIGVGLIGPRHAQTVLESTEATLTAIVDPAPAGQKFASSISIPYYSSIEELIQSPHRPDGAIVCTPNHTHVNLASKLASNRIHVLVEKPISIDIESGQDLISVAKTNNVHLLVGHHRRFNPYVTAAKQIVQSNELGSITAITGLWLMYKPLEYFTSAPWRQSKNGGGVLLINMIHEIDILQYLLGSISRVFAEKSISNRGFEAEEGAAVTLRFRSGIVGTFLISDNCVSPNSFESGTGENPIIPKTGEDFLRIFGTAGSLAVPSLKLWKYTDGQEKSWLNKLSVEASGSPSAAVPFELQLQNFIGVIRGTDVVRCSGQDGLSALAVCEALKLSLETEQPVYVDNILS